MLLGALQQLPEPPALQPYVLSMRAEVPDGAIRFPLPAALAHRLWSHLAWPSADRPLGHPAVIHGTNYVVPPSGYASRLVSVYDGWFLLNPGGVNPDVARTAAVLRRAVRHGATVHCSSQATADLITGLLSPRRVEMIPLGHLPLASPPAHPSPAIASRLGDRPFLLSVSTVERRKNLTTLVEAFRRLAGAEPDLRLVIAGAPGNDSDALDTAIAALPSAVAQRVILAGRVDESDKSWLVHRAQLLAYPSLDEGFGFPLLEAMSASTPVVASTAGSIPEVAGDAAVLVESLDAEALAAAIGEVLHDDARRASLIAAGHVRAAAYSWTNTASRMAALYRRLAMESAA